MASNSTADLDPVLNLAYQKAKAAWIKLHPEGPIVVLTCTYRSNKVQTELYNQPTDRKDNDGDGKIDEADEKVTNARAGQSAHNLYPSCAFDVGFINGKKMDWSVKLFNEFATILLNQSEGITWGGHFKSLMDRPHFELTGWRSRKK